MDYNTLLHKYINDINRYSYWRSKIFHYISTNTNKNNLYELSKQEIIDNQIGGVSYSGTIDNIKFKIDYYTNEHDDNTQIYIIEHDSETKYCVNLSYYNNETLNIGLIETPVRCIIIMDKNVSNEAMNTKIKYGEFMMKIIIQFAKDKGFKRIFADDISRFTCLDALNKYSYNLIYVHTLTSGTPWYYKFGFRLIDKDDDNIVNKNKIIILSKKTSDLSFDRLILFILNKDNNILTNDKLLDIVKLYREYKNKSLCDFLANFTRSYCDIMSLIYPDIYRYFELKKIMSTEMELIINA